MPVAVDKILILRVHGKQAKPVGLVTNPNFFGNNQGQKDEGIY